MTSLRDAPADGTPAGALAGYRVLDLSGEEGQFCGRLLAGMGADVVKVEPPAGDGVRRLGPFYHDEPSLETSLRWFTLNAGKRGITLDLDTPDGGALFKRVAADADIVIESFAPGYLDARGLGYRDLSRDNRGLVLTSITGYGQTGPLSEAAWSDIVALATGGLMYLTGDPDRPPVRFLSPQAFFQASAQAATGTLLALYHREATGEGQQVDVSMQEAVTYTIEGPGTKMSYWTMLGINVGRAGERRQVGALSVPTTLPCSDGWVALNAFGNMFGNLIQALADDDAAADLVEERWRTATLTAPHPGQWQVTQAELDHVYEVITAWTRRHTKEEIYRTALEYRFMTYPVNDAADLLASEQLQAREYFAEIEHPTLDATLTYPGAPFRMSATPWRPGPAAPRLGEHNIEVYCGDMGLSRAELGTLLAARVV